MAKHKHKKMEILFFNVWQDFSETFENCSIFTYVVYLTSHILQHRIFQDLQRYYYLFNHNFHSTLFIFIRIIPIPSSLKHKNIHTISHTLSLSLSLSFSLTLYLSLFPLSLILILTLSCTLSSI